MVKKQSWFQRRHDYRPESIGLTEPTPRVAPHDILDVTTHTPGYEGISVRLDHTNKLIQEILRVHMHDKITENDIDVSDSVSYTLASGEAAEVSYNVPSNYVMLLQNYFTSLSDDTTYYVYLDDEVCQRSPDMTFIGAMGLAIAPQVTFKMYVINTYTAPQSYISSIKASIRRVSDWDYPTYSYKKPV